jgi:hypothetical protein
MGTPGRARPVRHARSGTPGQARGQKHGTTLAKGTRYVNGPLGSRTTNERAL